MQYSELRYLPESEDPSLTIETERLVMKAIDNTGLIARVPDSRSYFNATHRITPLSHHLGYHGIRTFYDREEKRNLVVPFASWLNLQTVELAGIETDQVDERAWAGAARGWPLRIEGKGRGALLRLEPLPSMRIRYELELQPAEPDGLDFLVRFEFGRRPEKGPARFRATWPCYMNAFDEVRLFYPRSRPAGGWEWASIGEKPDMIVGETVGYRHSQKLFLVEDAAIPLGYGRIGERALIIMLNDPRVRLFVVNAGGHFAFSAVQNPAWDFEWVIEDYPLGTEVGFRGRLVYARFESGERAVERYRQWIAGLG